MSKARESTKAVRAPCQSEGGRQGDGACRVMREKPKMQDWCRTSRGKRRGEESRTERRARGREDPRPATDARRSRCFRDGSTAPLPSYAGARRASVLRRERTRVRTRVGRASRTNVSCPNERRRGSDGHSERRRAPSTGQRNKMNGRAKSGSRNLRVAPGLPHPPDQPLSASFQGVESATLHAVFIPR